MPQFQHQRHKPATPLERPRALILALPSMRSGVNLSRIVRAAGCSGVERIIVCGTAKIDQKIARDAADVVTIESRRSLGPTLKRLKGEGYTLVGLEQTTDSQSVHTFPFERKTVLVVGSEREGIAADLLAQLDAVVEIPVWGLPHSYNVATATAIVLYEYCRQFPRG